MSISRIYPELMYIEVIIPIISMSTCIVIGILGILYTQVIMQYPPETVIIFILLWCVTAKVVCSWASIWAGIVSVVAPAFATTGVALQ
jgi:hypothetical protein